MTRPASADCRLQLASRAAHPPAAAPTRTCVAPRSIHSSSESVASRSRAPVNQLHEFDVPVARAPTLRHTIRVLNAISPSVQAFALDRHVSSPPARRPRRRARRSWPSAATSFLKSARRSMPGTDRGRDRRLPNADAVSDPALRQMVAADPAACDSVDRARWQIL